MHDPTLTDLLWEKASTVLYVTKAQFLASLEGWTITPVEHAGELVVITVTKGPELHFQALGKPIPMAVVRSIVGTILEQHGHVVVRTPKTEPRQQRFNRAIGFVQTGEDDYDIHFRMDRFRERSAPCQ